MINIRKATYDDYESFAQVEKEVSDLHAKQNPLVFQFTEGYSFSREYFEDLIGKKDHQFLLAEDSKMIVGYAIAYPKESEYLSILRPRKWMFLMSF